jgi:hypothetical protein
MASLKASNNCVDATKKEYDFSFLFSTRRFTANARLMRHFEEKTGVRVLLRRFEPSIVPWKNFFSQKIRSRMSDLPASAAESAASSKQETSARIPGSMQPVEPSQTAPINAVPMQPAPQPPLPPQPSALTAESGPAAPAVSTGERRRRFELVPSNATSTLPTAMTSVLPPPPVKTMDVVPQPTVTSVQPIKMDEVATTVQPTAVVQSAPVPASQPVSVPVTAVPSDDEDEEHKVIASDPTGAISLLDKSASNLSLYCILGRFECYAKCLGMGAYKRVHLGFDQEEGVEVAWNELRLDHLQRKVRFQGYPLIFTFIIFRTSLKSCRRCKSCNNCGTSPSSTFSIPGFQKARLGEIKFTLLRN